MDQEKLKKIKEILEKASILHQKDPSILENIANLFHLEIDMNRYDDYEIKSIESSPLKIEITDCKKNITYISIYTRSIEIDAFFRKGTLYNRVFAIKNDLIIERIYSSDSTLPLKIKIIFQDGSYDLIFEKMEITNDQGETHKKFIIRYVEINDENEHENLWTKVYAKSNLPENRNEEFEQVYIGGKFLKKKEHIEDKYAYIKNNNIIYGIDRIVEDDNFHYFYGICFENLDLNIKDYIPLFMHSRVYSSLSDKKNISAIVLRGGTRDGKHHFIEISKDKEKILLNYYTEVYHTLKQNLKEIRQKEITINPTHDGSITNVELIDIMERIEKDFEQNEFIKIVLQELKIFAIKISHNNKIAKEEFDLLSPKVWIDKNMNEIFELFHQNKKECFQIAEEQCNYSKNLSKILTKYLRNNQS